MKLYLVCVAVLIVSLNSQSSKLTLTNDSFQSDDGYAMAALVNSQSAFVARKEGYKTYKSAKFIKSSW